MTNASTQHPLRATTVASNILRLEGLVALPTDPRVVRAEQVDLEEFMRNGFISYKDDRSTAAVVAYPRELTRVPPGQALPDGSTFDHQTLYLVCLMLDTDLARRVWKGAEFSYFGVTRGTWEPQAALPARVRDVGVYPITATKVA